MTKQEQIDRICTKLLGWHKEYSAGSWAWYDAKGHLAALKGFDPFTNPSGCARVMDEADRRGLWSEIQRRDAVAFAEISNPITYAEWKASGETRWEAFCLAVLEMIGEG